MNRFTANYCSPAWQVHETWVDGPRHVEIDQCCTRSGPNNDTSTSTHGDTSTSALKASDAQLLPGGAKTAIQRQVGDLMRCRLPGHT